VFSSALSAKEGQMDNENLLRNLKRVNQTLNNFMAEAGQKIDQLEDHVQALTAKLELLEKRSGG
jgi:hypothetical protein